MPPIYHCSPGYFDKYFRENEFGIKPHVPDGQNYFKYEKVENKMRTVSSEIIEIFSEPDFHKNLTRLAEEFGAETTLGQVNYWYEQNREMPTKLINGKTYKAGYAGPDMIAEGQYKAQLVQVGQRGKDFKALFDIENRNIYLYYTVPKQDISIEDIVWFGNHVGSQFDVSVIHETIPNTGAKHAVIKHVHML